MKYCIYCGGKLTDEDQFCIYCGKKSQDGGVGDSSAKAKKPGRKFPWKIAIPVLAVVVVAAAAVAGSSVLKWLFGGILAFFLKNVKRN